MEIRKGILEMKKAGKLYTIVSKTTSCNLTTTHANVCRPYGYTRLNNFGIKYSGKQHSQHLINALQQKKIIAEWTGKLPGIGNRLELPR